MINITTLQGINC